MTLSEIQEKRAQRLSAAIKASGLSYTELEKLTGIPSSSLQRYASGTTKKIPTDYLVIIANVLHIDAQTLIWGDSKETKEALPTEAESAFFDKIKGLQLSQAELDRIYDFAKFTSSEDTTE